MAESTAIEWTDHTFNPWWGCEKVSPGCAHCYAEGVSNHRAGKGLWGAGHRFRFFGDGHWKEPLKWDRASERDVRDQVGLKRRHRVFCASMADVFEERPELEEHRLRLFDLIRATPHLDWQVLTKRPEFARDWLRRWYEEPIAATPGQPGDGPMFRYEGDDNWAWRDGWASTSWAMLPNVWLGVSIENARYTWRADVLREIPAAVRFLSCEPLLGSLFLSRPPTHTSSHGSVGGLKPLDLSGIDWVIVGGESGAKARPMHVEWAREIVAACIPSYDDCDCNVPVLEGHGQHSPGCSIFKHPRPAIFVKQLGAHPCTTLAHEERLAGGPVGISYHHAHGELLCKKLADRKGGDWDEWPADLRIREFPAPAAVAPDSRPVPA